MESKGVVVVVDDDARILQSLASLLESVGYRAAVFGLTERDGSMLREVECGSLEDDDPERSSVSALLAWLNGAASPMAGAATAAE